MIVYLGGFPTFESLGSSKCSSTARVNKHSREREVGHVRIIWTIRARSWFWHYFLPLSLNECDGSGSWTGQSGSWDRRCLPWKSIFLYNWVTTLSTRNPLYILFSAFLSAALTFNHCSWTVILGSSLNKGLKDSWHLPVFVVIAHLLTTGTSLFNDQGRPGALVNRENDFRFHMALYDFLVDSGHRLWRICFPWSWSQGKSWGGLLPCKGQRYCLRRVYSKSYIKFHSDQTSYLPKDEHLSNPS